MEDDFVGIGANKPGEEVDLPQPAATTKEKITKFVRRNVLKFKEHFGKLSFAEFDELMDYDFESVTRRIKPLETRFDPEIEADRLESLQEAEKHDGMRGFRNKLRRQRLAWAECRVFVERAIEFDQDVPRDKLQRIVDKFGATYGFSSLHEETSTDMLDSFVVNRQRIKDVRQDYPDDRELVRELTGVPFDGKHLEVVAGPYAFEVHADSGYLQKVYDSTATRTKGSGFSGFAQEQSSLGVPLIAIVRGFWGEGGKSTQIHENQHIRKALFRELFEKSITEQERVALRERYESEQDPELKKAYLADYFRREREAAFASVKDEIFAYKKDGSSGTETQIQLLGKGSRNAYDYLYDVRNSQNKNGIDLKSGLKAIKEAVSTHITWRKLSNKILVKEYDAIVKKAIRSFERLKRKGGFTTSQTIALLFDIPLEEWPKEVKNLTDRSN